MTTFIPRPLRPLPFWPFSTATFYSGIGLCDPSPLEVTFSQIFNQEHPPRVHMECHRLESQSMCPSQPFKEPLGAHIIDTIRIFMLIHIVCVNFIARQGAGRRRTQHDIRGVQKMEETQCRYTNEVVRASNLRRVDSGRQQHFARSARHPSHQRCLGCRVACILRQSAATKNEPEEKAGDGRRLANSKDRSQTNKSYSPSSRTCPPTWIYQHWTRGR